MPDPIRVPMPPAGVDLQRHFETLAQREDFGRALDLSVVEFDELAQLTRLSITGAKATATGMAVNYAVAWTAFHACADKTIHGQHLRIARGRIDGAAWVFEAAQPLPGRDTADEF
ncbi:MAG TPA: hypothetical protein VGE36_02295 [Roseateles sp.]